MTFSVVLPCYQNLALFRDALESVRCQTGVALEIVVTDDSTTDAIEEYVTEFGDERIRYRRSTEPHGAVANWNAGIALATGDVIIVLHHDERFGAPDHLQRVGMAMEGGAEVVVSPVLVDCQDRLAPYRLAAPWLQRLALGCPASLFAVNLIGPCACLAVRREHIRYFDERLHWLVDTDWYYTHLRHHSVTLLTDTSVRSVHGHGTQITDTLDLKASALADAVVLREKYRHRLFVRLAVWFHLHVMRGNIVPRQLKSLLRR